MIRVGDIVQPRGSRRQFLVDAHNREAHEWVLLALDSCQVVRISDNVARTIQPVRWDQ